jgi:hypothetical protein
MEAFLTQPARKGVSARTSNHASNSLPFLYRDCQPQNASREPPLELKPHFSLQPSAFSLFSQLPHPRRAVRPQHPLRRKRITL